MSPGLSDPNWWPAPPPPKPPPKIPASAIVIGAIVVVVVAAGIGFALLNPRAHHSTGPSVPVRSLAAFTSCLKQQGVLIPSAEFNDAMLRPAAVACRASVPLLGNPRDPVAAAEKAYAACEQNAESKLRQSLTSGIGAIAAIAGAGNASSSRAAYQQANAVCRAESFDEPGGGESIPGSSPASLA